MIICSSWLHANYKSHRWILLPYVQLCNRFHYQWTMKSRPMNYELPPTVSRCTDGSIYAYDETILFAWKCAQHCCIRYSMVISLLLTFHVRIIFANNSHIVSKSISMIKTKHRYIHLTLLRYDSKRINSVMTILSTIPNENLFCSLKSWSLKLERSGMLEAFNDETSLREKIEIFRDG